ncbi:hypothetical protein GUJ93_ZPchr0006g44107 [Zizania palustris]|uniref:Uncharacterized protein n=1 Tax=Zizania palustris TaxID=103762 RepID=A0A8J5SMR4_ZIZPA|nr:hypothetical protein GUJ93_ZPchr0006g44107 [Zizania palustris]
MNKTSFHIYHSTVSPPLSSKLPFHRRRRRRRRRRPPISSHSSASSKARHRARGLPSRALRLALRSRPCRNSGRALSIGRDSYVMHFW